MSVVTVCIYVKFLFFFYCFSFIATALYTIFFLIEQLFGNTKNYHNCLNSYAFHLQYIVKYRCPVCTQCFFFVVLLKIISEKNVK